MGDIVALNARHPLVGKWRDGDADGSSVRFVVRASGAAFEVSVVDTYDNEEIEVSNVNWDGRVLRFSTFVRSTGHQVEYEMRSTSPTDVSLRLSYAEPWVKEPE